MSKKRHHSYNFHIGFWGAVLVSSALLLHSAVFLIANAGIGFAQQSNSISITAPTEQSFVVGDQIPLEATTSSAQSNVSFTISDASGNTVFQKDATPNADFTVWDGGSWDATETGDYTISAEASGITETADIQITVSESISVNFLFKKPSDGQTLDSQTEFIVNLDTIVDSTSFILTDDTGEELPPISASLVPDSTGDWSASFNPADYENGDYTLHAEAALNGIVYKSNSSLTISVASIEGTIEISKPVSDEVLGNETYKFEAVTNKDATDVLFTIVPGISSSSDVFQAEAPQDPTQWEKDVDITQYDNGDYTVVASGTIDGTEILSNTIPFTIDNTVDTTEPLAITTNATLPSATVGARYSQQLQAQGGTPPYSWSPESSTALPDGLTLSNDGVISGTPQNAGTFTFEIFVTDSGTSASVSVSKTFTLNVEDQVAEPVCGDGLLQISNDEQCDDGNTLNGDGCSETCQIEEETTEEVTEIIPEIHTTTTQNEFADTNNVAVIESNVVIEKPEVMFVDSDGQSHQASVISVAKPFNDTSGETWQAVFDVRNVENGGYTIRVSAVTVDTSETINAEPLSVTVANPEEEEPVFEGGEIVRPSEGSNVSGGVLVEARIDGNVSSVTFRLIDSAGVSITENATFNEEEQLWEATLPVFESEPGEAEIRTEIFGENNEGPFSLPIRTINIPARTTPLEEVEQQREQERQQQQQEQQEQEAASLEEPRIEEVIEPEVLNNVDENGNVSEIPVECQIAGVTDEDRCGEYLRSRAIRLLNEEEQEQVREDLDLFVTRHIEVSEGRAVRREERRTDGEEGEPEQEVEDPLSEILPVEKNTTEKSNFLVSPSTTPPSNIRRFVEQTVPAVLIPDRDGDQLSDDAERQYGTDPENPDTDGDGYEDGEEVKNGFDPNGPGLLEKETAPINEAVLNKRPLDQPKFAGRINEEELSVDNVETVGEVDGKRLRMNGQARPNEYVTLYVYSSLPVVLSTRANESGDWEYEFSHPLRDGKHDVYVSVTDNTGKIQEKSRPLSFFIDAAQAVSEEEFLQANPEIRDTSNTFIYYYIAAGVLIILLGGLMVFYYVKQQKSF